MAEEYSLVNMPEISENEWKEYMALKRKEEIRQKEIDELIKKGLPKIKKWRKDLNTTRGMASTFANILLREYERRGKPETFVLDRWKTVQEYLPPKLVVRNKHRFDLQNHFRMLLRKYGWSVRINHKLGLFEVTKIF